MEVFPDVSKRVAQEIHKTELQHVQNWCSLEEIDQLALLKGDKITGYNVNELLCGEKFEIAEHSYSQEFNGLEFDCTQKMDLGFGFGVKFLGIKSKCNTKVTWYAKFDLTCKKLKTKRPLKEQLEKGELDINNPFVRSCFESCDDLKVVDSILYTNSDTVVSITTEPLLDASADMEFSGEREFKVKANYLDSGKSTVEIPLPANTVLAYGCVNLMIDMSNGKMKVDGKGGFCGTPAKDTNCASGKLTVGGKGGFCGTPAPKDANSSSGKMKVDSKDGFCGTPAPEDTNCASEGSQPSSSGAISLTVSIGIFLLVVNYNNIDRVIELLSKHVAQIMRKREPQHVQHQRSIEELEPVVKDEEKLKKEAELEQENARLRQVNEDLKKLNADKDKKIQERDRKIADKDKTVDKKVETDRFDMAIGSDERKNQRIQDYVFNSRNSRNSHNSRHSRNTDV